MPKNEVQVKKIPSGINIVINNSNKIDNAPKRRKRYIKKDNNSSTLDTQMQMPTGVAIPDKKTPRTTPMSIYASSYRTPISQMVPPLPPYQPPGAQTTVPPQPGFESVQLVEQLGNFGSRLLENFTPPAQIRSYTDSQTENIPDDANIPENAIIPENIINQIPNITEEQQREIRNRNKKIQAKRQGTIHGNKGIEPQGPYKDMEEYKQAYQTAIDNQELNQERKKKMLQQRKKKMYQQGKKDAEDGVYPLRHENDEDYMKGYNEFIDNLAYEEFVAEEGMVV
jgi:hypothetical protein